MAKTIFVSNRLSTTARLSPEGEISFKRSVGGLATGLSTIHEQEESLWIGWSGLTTEEVSEEQREYIFSTLLEEYKCVAVDVNQGELDLFYAGFCNRTIWPLFHYFTTFTDYDENTWRAYEVVNEKFFDQVASYAEDGDLIWVHDYQLMLLPRLIKERFPNSPVGFFLHIPFPSYEVFRNLPWRNEILNGLLGSDLIGFHTYDYARHFLSSIRRLIGYEHRLATVTLEDRVASVDVFPMGIDFDKYNDSSLQPEVQEHYRQISDQLTGQKMILSVDRLDYSKGILSRLHGFRRFLEENPEYLEQVTMVLIVSPSRENVEEYQALKREIDELIGEVNGGYQQMGWTPIWYFYRTLPFDELTALYQRADLLLVTALRDGMNLIAKEYVAAKRDETGIVVLSETAGAAREMSEALIINPFDQEGIAGAIREGLQMPEKEQKERHRRIRERLSRYNVEYWAKDFVTKLRKVHQLQKQHFARYLTSARQKELIQQYAKAKKRLLFLDYDGTIRRFTKRPSQAEPDAPLLDLLRRLSAEEGNEVVVISGRDRDVLDAWLGFLDVSVAAGHGIWIRERRGEWSLLEEVNDEWKSKIEPLIQFFVDRTPGSDLEEKDYSLAWHYRNAEPELAAVRLSELKDALLSFTSNLDLSLLEGNNVLEVKPSAFDKGRAVLRWLAEADWDFVLAAGDDHTDEYMFEALSGRGNTIKVGVGMSAAEYYVEKVEDVRSLLEAMLAT
ncbi:MAG: bifunctional alpha,alpha-trehalose-phosphate synthase (UDP-forming)/trehalose-phosphatase [Alkalispirochaetaceae bacterium]